MVVRRSNNLKGLQRLHILGNKDFVSQNSVLRCSMCSVTHLRSFCDTKCAINCLKASISRSRPHLVASAVSECILVSSSPGGSYRSKDQSAEDEALIRKFGRHLVTLLRTDRAWPGAPAVTSDTPDGKRPPEAQTLSGLPPSISVVLL